MMADEAGLPPAAKEETYAANTHHSHHDGGSECLKQGGSTNGIYPDDDDGDADGDGGDAESKKMKTMFTIGNCEVVKVTLEEIRQSLIRQETTIIFALVERAQFAANAKIYKRDQDSLLAHPQCRLAFEAEEEKKLSFMEYFLLRNERMDAELGRYADDQEHLFSQRFSVPNPALPRRKPLPAMKTNNININDQVLEKYLNQVIPVLCKPRDDGHYGSSSVCDIAALQALSRRVHYGKMVAEAKFQANTAKFTEFIEKQDSAGLMELLTDKEVEDKVVKRVQGKAERYGTDDSGTTVFKGDPYIIANLYREVLIPLNKDVQVKYLLQRLS